MNKPRRLRARPRSQTSGLEPGDAAGLPTPAGTPAADGSSALEQAIATSDDWVRLQEGSPDGFMLLRPLCDPAGQIVDFQCTHANPAAQRMLRPAAAHLGHLRPGRLLEFLPWAVDLTPFVEVIETGESKVFQQPVQANGRSGWWRLVIAKFADGIAVSLGDLNDGSKIPGLAATNGADSTLADRGRTEERLQESELRWRRLMDANVVGIVISDTERVIDVNQCFLDMVGYERDELVSEFRKVTLTPVEFAALDEAARQQLSSAGAVAPFEKEFRRKDGTRVPVLITGARLQEEPLSWIAFVMDLTERRRAEQQLRKSELRWRRLVESNVLGVAIADEARLLEANEVYLNLIGYTQQQLKAGQILRSNITPPEYSELDRRALEQMRETGLTTPYEKEYIRPDGTRVPVLIGPTVLTESPLSIIALVLDLSEQKRAQAALRESELRWRRLVESTIVGVVITNEERLLDANQAYLDMVGYTVDELRAGKVLRADLTPPEYQLFDRSGLEQLRLTGHCMPYEKEYLRRDGTRVPVLIASTTLTYSPLTWMGLVLDLTAQKRAQAALRESEEQLRALTKAAPAFLLNLRPSSECEYASEFYYEFTGRPPGSAAGTGWLEAMQPEDARAVLGHCEEARRTRQDFEIEYRLRRADGAYRWFKARLTGVRDRTGTVVRWYGGSLDIHEQKEVEAALKAADRRKDEFLAMLAHELRNPLAPIVNALEIIRLNDPGDQRLLRGREMIERQTRHLTRLVDELLEVSRITTGKLELRRETVEIGSILTQALEGARPLMESRNHQVEVALPYEPMQVDGDPMRLTQVLLNILNNAAKYTPEHGNIRLQAGREADRIVLRVRDNGYGISPTLLPHIFDLFTQGERAPDRSQGGLGIGLTVARTLIELHGGTIEAHSEGPGQGSEFVIRLPRLSAPARREVSLEQPVQGAHTARRVLVVDDNADCADSMAELLAIVGFEVKVARDGNAAIDLAISFTPEVILLDLGLPGIDGYEVARRLRKSFDLPDAASAGGRADPQLKRKLLLVAISGYGQEKDRARSRMAGFDYHLVKPVNHSELLNILGAAQ